MGDPYLEFPFTAAEPVWEVKECVGVVFQGDDGATPHQFDRLVRRSDVDVFERPALHFIAQVDLKQEGIVAVSATTTPRDGPTNASRTPTRLDF